MPGWSDDGGFVDLQALTFLAVFQQSVSPNLRSTPRRGTPVVLRGAPRAVFDRIAEGTTCGSIQTRRIPPSFVRPYNSYYNQAPGDLDSYYTSERVCIKKEIVIGEDPAFLGLFHLGETSASCCGPARQLRDGPFVVVCRLTLEWTRDPCFRRAVSKLAFRYDSCRLSIDNEIYYPNIPPRVSSRELSRTRRELVDRAVRAIPRWARVQFSFRIHRNFILRSDAGAEETAGARQRRTFPVRRPVTRSTASRHPDGDTPWGLDPDDRPVFSVAPS